MEYKTSFRNEIVYSYSKYPLSNNISIPILGLGTCGIKDQETMNIVLKSAYDSGYRLIDTASGYNNEKLIGNALKENKTYSAEFFIVTKIPSVDPSKARFLLEQSFENLQLDSIDLVLLHWPGFKTIEERISVWKILEEYVEKGKIKSIGVSNFRKNHLQTILDSCIIPPAINQIELHPLFIDYETISFCKENNIFIQAYSPFAKFNEKLIKNPVLLEICEKYEKSSSQVLVRWSIQHGFSVIPKSSNKDRIEENIRVNDFMLTQEDMERLDDLNCDFKIISKWDPRTVEF